MPTIVQNLPPATEPAANAKTLATPASFAQSDPFAQLLAKAVGIAKSAQADPVSADIAGIVGDSTQTDSDGNRVGALLAGAVLGLPGVLQPTDFVQVAAGLQSAGTFATTPISDGTNPVQQQLVSFLLPTAKDQTNGAVLAGLNADQQQTDGVAPLVPTNTAAAASINDVPVIIGDVPTPAALAAAATLAVSHTPAQIPTSNIPPPAPIVTELTPRQPALVQSRADLSQGPTRPDAIAALPDARVGDRPSTSGERIAANLSSAIQVVESRPASASQAFKSALAASLSGQPAALPSISNSSPSSPLVEAAAAANQGPGTANLTNNLSAKFELNSLLGVGSPSVYQVDRRNDESRDPGSADTTSTSSSSIPPNAVPAAMIPSTSSAKSATGTMASPAAQIADGITANSHRLERDGTVEFRLRLDPPDLGRVRVHLISTGDELRGHLIVADDSVRRLIESQLPELRQRLQSVGVAVERFDITADSGGGQRNAQQGPPSTEWLPREARAPVSPSRPRSASVPVGRLDVTV